MTPLNPITSLARTLQALPVAERRDHFASAVIERGGRYTVPRNLPPGRAIVMLSLEGIETSGWFEDAAIESWIRIALGHETAA